MPSNTLAFTSLYHHSRSFYWSLKGIHKNLYTKNPPTRITQSSSILIMSAIPKFLSKYKVSIFKVWVSTGTHASCVTWLSWKSPVSPPAPQQAVKWPRIEQPFFQRLTLTLVYLFVSFCHECGYSSISGET